MKITMEFEPVATGAVGGGTGGGAWAAGTGGGGCGTPTKLP